MSQSAPSSAEAAAPVAPPALDEPERFAPLRPPWKVWTGETIVLAVTFLLANALFAPESPGWLEARPHPLYAIPLLIAVRYGFGPGALSGAVAAVIHLAAQAYVNGGAVTALHPAMLLLAGLILGEVRQRQLMRERYHRQQSSEAQGEVALLRERLDVEREARAYLERRLVEPGTSVAMLYEAAQKLESLDEEGLYPALLEVLTRHLDARRCGILVLEEGTLRPRIASGTDEDSAKAWCDLDLVGRALAERRTLSVRDVPGGGAEVVLAAPLLSPEDEVLGVVVIADLPFVRLTAHAARTLSLLGRWGGRALARARYVAEIRASAVFDEERGVLRYSYFATRLDEEFDRAQRYGYPLTVLAVTIVDLGQLSDEVAERVLLALATVLTQVLRTVDQVFCHPESRTFMLCLPHTPRSGAERARERIEEKLALLALTPYPEPKRPLEVAIGHASYDPREEGAVSLTAEGLAKAAQRASAGALPALPEESE